MIGAIAGDIIGSAYEFNPIKTSDFRLFTKHSRFTDDTVMTIASAYSILHKASYSDSMRKFGRKYPNAGYGGSFMKWILDPAGKPYNSWGNGSAMRVGPVGFAFSSIEEVLAEAQKNAEITHNHPEGVKGAQATALAIYLARTGTSKDTIRAEISNRFGYNLKKRVSEFRSDYSFDVSCQGSVPEAITAFLESKNYEDAVRIAVSLGGDSDTQACIAGSIAQGFYREIPSDIISETRSRLPQEFLKIIASFEEKFM
jgi:ADP-ribosylglycohydrolase